MNVKPLLTGYHLDAEDIKKYIIQGLGLDIYTSLDIRISFVIDSDDECELQGAYVDVSFK